jgi:predicted small lipoprotein YifL
MKKVLSIFLVAAIGLVLLAGCGPKEPEVPPEPVITKIGLGQKTTISKSTEMTVKDDQLVPPVAQVDTVFAAVAFDKDGKVVKVQIDTAQTKVTYDSKLQVTSDLSAAGKTKKELADEYGMKKVSEIGKEWYEQIEELEKWMVGKTVEEIKSMKTKERDESHKAVPDVPELTSLVTISVEDYLAVVEEAYEKAVEVPEGVKKLGLGHVISIAKSVGYSVIEGKETLPQAEVDLTMAAAGFDESGKVMCANIDVSQAKVKYDKDGKLLSDIAAEVKTKKELGEEYGMKTLSQIGKEWYEQIAELEKWMVGKTVEEIKGLKVKERDESHKAVPDVPELTSLVTITVEDYLAVIAKAYDNAK